MLSSGELFQAQSLKSQTRYKGSLDDLSLIPPFSPFRFSQGDSQRDDFGFATRDCLTSISRLFSGRNCHLLSLFLDTIALFILQNCHMSVYRLLPTFLRKRLSLVLFFHFYYLLVGSKNLLQFSWMFQDETCVYQSSVLSRNCLFDLISHRLSSHETIPCLSFPFHPHELHRADLFLDADTQLYKRLCPSVGPSVGP